MLVSEVNRTRRDVLGDDVSVTVSETGAPSGTVVSGTISEAGAPSGIVVSRVPLTGSFVVCAATSKMGPLCAWLGYSHKSDLNSCAGDVLMVDVWSRVDELGGGVVKVR